MNTLKERIAKKEPVLGTLVFIPSPTIIEILGYAGFDFAVIDTEHAPISPYDTRLIENMARAAQITGITPIVRLPRPDKAMTQKVLDAGAHGVMVSGVKTKEDAVKIVQNAMYPPLGNRGCCSLTRPTGYSAKYVEDYWNKANQSTIVIPLIETKEGVDNLREILTVDNIDFISFGPRDYSMSRGYSNVDNPETNKAREYVKQVCRELDTPMDRFVYPPFDKTVRKAIKEGYNVLTAGVDVSLFLHACKNVAESIHNPPL